MNNLSNDLIKLIPKKELEQEYRFDLYHDLHNLYFNILDIKNNFEIFVDRLKNEDFTLFLSIDEEKGVKSIDEIPLNELEKIEHKKDLKYKWNSGGQTFENWQIAHFQILFGREKWDKISCSTIRKKNFTRTCKTYVKSEFEKIGRIHLYCLNYRGLNLAKGPNQYLDILINPS